MSLILEKRPTLKDVAINAALILCTSFSCAGAILFLSWLSASSLYASLASPLHANYATALVGTIAGGWMAAVVYDKAFLRLEGLEYAKAAIECNGKREEAVLLNDTGNLLRTATGHPVIFLNATMFQKLTGIDRLVFSGFEEYMAYYESLPASIRGRISATSVQSANSLSLQIVFKADKIVFQGLAFLAPAYISGSENMKELTFDGIYNHKFLMERYRYEEDTQNA